MCCRHTHRRGSRGPVAALRQQIPGETEALSPCWLFEAVSKAPFALKGREGLSWEQWLWRNPSLGSLRTKKGYFFKSLWRGGKNWRKTTKKIKLHWRIILHVEKEKIRAARWCCRGSSAPATESHVCPVTLPKAWLWPSGSSLLVQGRHPCTCFPLTGHRARLGLWMSARREDSPVVTTPT